MLKCRCSELEEVNAEDEYINQKAIHQDCKKSTFTVQECMKGAQDVIYSGVQSSSLRQCLIPIKELARLPVGRS